jgi:SAM-dependent methyltransferase
MSRRALPVATSIFQAQHGSQTERCDVFLSRRDKRRHLPTSSTMTDLCEDPFEMIALAVRFDESRQMETLLKAPLEGGRLHDHSKLFSTILQFLLEKTDKPSRLTHYTKRKDIPFALTPIVLSGLLAAIQEQRDERDEDEDIFDDSIASELVGFCQYMRQAAINRLRFNKKRNRLQHIVLSILCISVALALFLRSEAKTRRALQALGFTHSCDIRNGDVFLNNEHYVSVCHMTEAALWATYGDYLLTLDKRCRDDECGHPLLVGRYAESPFSMHTALSRHLIRSQELYGSGSSSTQSAPISIPPNIGSETSQRWLGETAVNRLVCQILDDYLPGNKERYILDAGCGVGGTMFSLLPSLDTKQKAFRYRGISLSGAEVHFAQGLADYHGLDSRKSNNKTSNSIVFEQGNYDSKLPPRVYDAVVAIESLSSSPDLEKSLANFIQSLKNEGILLIVDDVEGGQDESPMMGGEKLLNAHSYWFSTLERLGCKVVVARDLSLEFELTDMDYRLGWDIFPLSWRLLLAPAARLGYAKDAGSRRMVELRKGHRRIAEVRSRRYRGFVQAQLSYNIYVCRRHS